MGSVPTLPTVSVISLVYSDLPYIRSISLTTPSLYLQIDNLSITFILVTVLSGSLSIIRAEDIAIKARDYESVNIPDIPTNAEMEFHCLDGSNKLTIQLKNKYMIKYSR